MERADKIIGFEALNPLTAALNLQAIIRMRLRLHVFGVGIPQSDKLY
jgi:hypothetical protein